MTTTKISLIAVTALVLGTIAAAGTARLAFAATQIADGEGKDIVTNACSGCHGLNVITESDGHAKDGWQRVMDSMVEMGASFDAKEVPIIINYLAAHYPPKG